DRPQPATACLVQDRIGAVNAAAYDINAVCAGFVFALLTGAQLLAGTETGIAPGYGLVIGADTYSRIIDPQDRRTAPLFGDGAGAVVLGPVPSDRGLVGGGAATDGGRHGDIRVEAGGSRLPASEKTVYEEMHFFRMEGRRVREYVTEQLPRAVQEVL
ncbi:3-oxoacyl-ACP synthase III family protein, partial [Peterkaempfera griseoplana]|uniref:3-oxoacyl-ACP synthase III family protein n=1 Tax=Peterkaempfera griseoplana TaxID=66896 RepID=UPI00389AF5F7